MSCEDETVSQIYSIENVDQLLNFLQKTDKQYEDLLKIYTQTHSTVTDQDENVKKSFKILFE